MDSAIRKAGFTGTITESLRRRVRLTRYQSSLFTLHLRRSGGLLQSRRGPPRCCNPRGRRGSVLFLASPPPHHRL